MIEQIRKAYNSEFSEEKYKALLSDIDSTFNYEVRFKIAETPVFIPKELKAKL